MAFADYFSEKPGYPKWSWTLSGGLTLRVQWEGPWTAPWVPPWFYIDQSGTRLVLDNYTSEGHSVPENKICYMNGKSVYRRRVVEATYVPIKGSPGTKKEAEEELTRESGLDPEIWTLTFNFNVEHLTIPAAKLYWGKLGGSPTTLTGSSGVHIFGMTEITAMKKASISKTFLTWCQGKINESSMLKYGQHEVMFLGGSSGESVEVKEEPGKEPIIKCVPTTALRFVAKDHSWNKAWKEGSKDDAGSWEDFGVIDAEGKLRPVYPAVNLGLLLQ